MSADKRESKTISVRLSKAEADAVDDAAKEAGLTRPEYMRACLRRGMDEACGTFSDAISLTGPTVSLVDVLWELQQTCEACRGLFVCFAEIFDEEGDSDGFARAEEVLRLMDAMQGSALDVLERALEILNEAKRTLEEL